MSARYLLDTDTCIDLLRGNEIVILRAKQASPDACAVSSVTVYELLVGAAKSTRPERESAKVHLFVSTMHQQPFDAAAAQRTAHVRAALERDGRMIGPYDVMLAGQALALGLRLVSSNLREFERVDGLKSESWR